jgi:hypothetical protein
MDELPYAVPLNIARGLENLAEFIASAGFAEAARLVRMAALAAWDDIARVPAAPDQPRKGKARAKETQASAVILLHPNRQVRGNDEDDSADYGDPG